MFSTQCMEVEGAFQPKNRSNVFFVLGEPSLVHLLIYLQPSRTPLLLASQARLHLRLDMTRKSYLQWKAYNMDNINY